MFLSELPSKQKAKIIKIINKASEEDYLSHFGIKSGAIVSIERRTLFGSTLKILVNGKYLMLRKKEAQLIEIEKVL